MEARNGLLELPTFLSPRKAEVAARITAQGRKPSAEDFDRQGHTLSDGERAALETWYETGFRTRVLEQVRSADGTVRMVIGLQDGIKKFEGTPEQLDKKALQEIYAMEVL